MDSSGSPGTLRTSAKDPQNCQEKEHFQSMTWPTWPSTVANGYATTIPSYACCHILSLPSIWSSLDRHSPLHATQLQSSTLLSLYSVGQATCAEWWNTLSNDVLVSLRLTKLTGKRVLHGSFTDFTNGAMIQQVGN